MSDSGTAQTSKLVPPIASDEILYRRILPGGGWIKNHKQVDPIPLKWLIPRPWVSELKKGDTNGLSVNRSRLITLNEASIRPDTGKQAHVIEFTVKTVVEIGLTVKPDPLFNPPHPTEDISHALIPELNSVPMDDPDKETRRQNKLIEYASMLREKSTLVYIAP